MSDIYNNRRNCRYGEQRRELVTMYRGNDPYPTILRMDQKPGRVPRGFDTDKIPYTSAQDGEQAVEHIQVPNFYMMIGVVVQLLSGID